MTDILAVEGDFAGGDIVEAGDQIAERGLPGTGRPYDCDLLPGVDREVQIPEHPVVVVRVFKGDVMEADLSLRIDKRYRARIIEDVDVRVHDLQKPLDPGHALLELLRELDDAPDRGDEGCDIHDIGHHVACRDLPADKEQSSADDDHKVIHTLEDAGRHLKVRHAAIRRLLDPEERLISLRKLLLFPVLIGKGLDHLLPEKTVLDLRIELTGLVAPLCKRGPHPLSHMHADDDHDRGHRKGHEGQGYVDPDKDHEGHRHLDPGDEELLRTVMCKFGNVEQVRRNPAHDLPDLGVVEIRIREIDQMMIGIPPKVRLDVCAHDVTLIGHEEGGKGIDHAKDQIE